jgi:integrase/recombinase XerD
MTERTVKDRNTSSGFDDYIEPLLEHLRAAGYAERTLIKKRTVARAFGRWSKRKLITPAELNDSHARAFVGRSPQSHLTRQKEEASFMGLLLDYLRFIAVLQPKRPEQSVSPAESLLLNYQTYLCKDCGLTKNTRLVYVPFIRTFLASQATKKGLIAPEAFDELKIRSFIVNARLAVQASISGCYARPFVRFFISSSSTR